MHHLLTRTENFIPDLGLPTAEAVRTAMIFVPGGAFRMGRKPDDNQAYSDEKPEHEVMIPPFFIGQYPVTQAFWKAVLLGDDPALFKGDDRPVDSISWDRIRQEFLPALQTQTGIAFRLPTEAEWEYAARGGPYWEDGFVFSGSHKLKEVGWFEGNGHGMTKPVGLKYPNQISLYDMSGNLWEWVEDQWHGNYEGAPADGSAWTDQKEEGVHRVLRGGGYWGGSRFCRSTNRDSHHPAYGYRYYGFRLATPFQAVDLYSKMEPGLPGLERIF